MINKKDALLVIGTIAAFGVGYILGHDNVIRKINAKRTKAAELQTLLMELNEYMKKNFFNPAVSPEEYQREIQSRIEFINAVKGY